MSSEPDCAASSGGFVLESSLSSIISSHRKSNSNTINSDKISNNNNEDTDCDLEKSVCASSNNNNFNVNNNNLTSATGSLTSNGSLKNSGTTNSSFVAASSNFLNDNATNPDGKFNTLKCERCDSFETISHALLLVHVAQCRGDANNVNSGTSRQFTIDALNANSESGTENDSTMDATSVSASSTVLHNSASDSIQLKQNADGNSNNGTTAQRKLFECDVCNMKFSNGANMRRHKMRHTGVKPYECRVCQKRFFRKDHLAEHFTTHTKTLPYHCPICNRGFQRQIAMRAHFQNEHVGQNDLVKTCPLCNYRAGTMKSLRIHFFNRHGIDLDNPGPNAPSSLLLALDPTNASNYLPSIALAAAAAAAAANNSNLSLSGNNGGNSNNGPSFSDSGDSLQDSLRSTENGTPPMHFLTPHVEISMADNDTYKSEPLATSMNSSLEIQPCATTINRPLNGGSPSPHSADSNSNMPSSSQSIIGNALQNSRNLHHDGQITPSISLIPIKQEPSSDDYDSMSKSVRQQNNDQNSSPANSIDHNATSSSSLTSLIKVSPLKSLLREDLKRRISARATNRATRNSNNANNNGISSSANSSTSSSSSSFSKSTNSATAITNTINAINQHLLSNSAISVTSESTNANTGTYNGNAPRSPVATTSNGAITSTGASETELLLAAVSSGHRGKRMLQCQFCGIDFPDQTLYFLHKGCHSDSNAWKCNICGEQCNNVYEFNSHLLSKSHQ